MRKIGFLVVCFAVFTSFLHAENDSVVVQNVRNWNLGGLGARIDSIPVDTAFYRINNYNSVTREYPHVFYLSNKGTAYHSNSLVDQYRTDDFLFISNLSLYFRNPADIEFYNTTTPYTNIQYYYATPKRRSEENISVLHTQNVTKNWNVGLNYALSSSIGRYDASQADYRNFRFFSSYQGERYSIHGAIIYNKSFNYENGGIVNDSNVIKNNEALEPENIPVYFRTALNKTENYRAYFAQSYGIGSLKFMSTDSLTQVPLATIFLTTDLNQYDRTYQIDNDELKYSFYDRFYVDSLSTRDSTRYTAINNTFQIKFNEEANSLLRFGVRGFIGNSIETFLLQSPNVVTSSKDTITYYKSENEVLVSSFVGGEVFKNLGENFWWRGGAKFYIQGYKIGELEANASIDSRFKVLGEVAGVFANGSFEFKTPNYYQNTYFSNHFAWSNDFRKQKIMRANFGIKIPTRDFKISAHANVLGDGIYWDESYMPVQSSDVVLTYGASLYKHFKIWNLHSVDDLLVQYSSNQNITPLPTFSIYSSNYYQPNLFKVLTLQLGFDVRYHTAYYSPKYNPALGAFAIQHERKIGDFPFITPFLNAHIKRFNFYVQYDFVNAGWPSYDYFLTVGYPNNPGTLKFGVTWNFYD